jgi:ADP-ribose pyrophosphatase YjhB (NUDIX family)
VSSVEGSSLGLAENEITDSDYSKENIEGIITDKDLNDVKILLVQSKGQFWGPPKGSLNPGESIINAAIREVKEETGIDFDKKNIGEIRVVKGSCYYFHLNIDEIPVTIQTSLEGNDANGIGWFRVECLNNMVKSGKLQINQHCTLLIKKILGYTISQNTPIQRSAKISFVKI